MLQGDRHLFFEILPGLAYSNEKDVRLREILFSVRNMGFFTTVVLVVTKMTLTDLNGVEYRKLPRFNEGKHLRFFICLPP